MLYTTIPTLRKVLVLHALMFVAMPAPAQAQSVNFLAKHAEKDLLSALNEALGQGHGHKIDNLEEISATLQPTFVAVPKNYLGRLAAPAVRYLVHNYFMQVHGWLIAGLEPHRNNSATSAPDMLPVLAQKVPNYIENIVAAQWEKGFDLEDVTVMVALIEHLILNEGVQTLEGAYEVNDYSVHDALPDSSLDTVLTSHLLLFVYGNRRDPRNKTQHQLDRQRITATWPDWTKREMLAEDLHRNYAFSSESRASPFSERLFSFEEVTQIMATLNQQFGKFHDADCQTLKEGLVGLDSKSSGRVALGTFYRQRRVGYWHLLESQEYLRQLGALDESSPGRGPQVMIPNYVTAMSNCDAPSEFYSICCIHECTSLLNRIEVQLQKPTAKASQILQLVSGLSSPTIEAPRNLSAALVGSLEKVAHMHGGEIPMHGRLFAQWMHYAFPYECPYPHMTGTLNPLNPAQYMRETGGGPLVSGADLKKAVRTKVDEEFDAMSMWTLEEEMRAGVSAEGMFLPALSTVMQVLVAGLIVLSLGRTMVNQVSSWSSSPASVPFASNKKTEFLV